MFEKKEVFKNDFTAKNNSGKTGFQIAGDMWNSSNHSTSMVCGWHFSKSHFLKIQTVLEFIRKTFPGDPNHFHQKRATKPLSKFV